MDYKTQWVEYPDIASTLSPQSVHPPPLKKPANHPISVVPNEPGEDPYTVPAMRIGNIHLMDSASLATFLEGQYPSPSLHVSPLIQEVEKMTRRVMRPTQAIWLPLVSRNILNPSSKEKMLEWIEKITSHIKTMERANNQGVCI